jgi:hypothetical protein
VSFTTRRSPDENVSEWAKQQACRKSALEAKVPVVKGIEDWIITGDERRAIIQEQRTTGQIDQSLDAVTQVLEHGESYWQSLREFCQTKRILSPFDERALVPAVCRQNISDLGLAI